MVPSAPHPGVCERAARVHRLWFRGVDRHCSVCLGVVFCMETMVAVSRDVDCGCTRRHASERVGEASCSQATAFSRWSICGLVWLQFCQWSHHRSHSSYGQLLLFVLPALKGRHWRRLSILSAISLVALVGFSRVALGAHFLTDVLAAVFFGIIWLAFCLFATKSMRRTVSPAFVPLVSEPALLHVELAEPAQNLPS